MGKPLETVGSDIWENEASMVRGDVGLIGFVSAFRVHIGALTCEEFAGLVEHGSLHLWAPLQPHQLWGTTPNSTGLLLRNLK